jgi:penicillin-binding protein 1A
MPIREYHRDILRQKKRRKSFSFFRFFALFFASFLVLSVLGGLLLFIYYAKDLPRPEKFLERELVQSTKIYDRTGKVLLFEIYGEEKREYVSLEKIPVYLREAVIVAEDANFYHHFGIDLKAIGRAILADLKLREPVQGASTIPQQLIRSSFLTREKTLERKTKEIILTLELDRKYPKDQILEWYLNQVPFGPNIYGVETASKGYFGKSVSEITLAQAALLAATIKAPSYLYPYGEHLEELLGRKDYILNRMADLGYISQEEKEKTQKEETKFAGPSSKILAPHFVMYVRDLLEQEYGYGEDFLKEKGLKVYTTLDADLQKSAEEIVKNQSKINEKYRAFNASLVALSPKTGEILAMVGSKDWFSPPYPDGCIPGKNCLFEPYPNVVLRGRQPGSAFKPFVYATAFKKGFDDKEIIIDEETNFGIWGGEEYVPRNYDGKFRGPITVRESLAQSINVTSIKILRDLAGLGDMNRGLEDSAKTAQDLGITTLKSPYYPSIVLGGQEVKLLEMVSAYGVFATEGLKTEPTAILKVEDSKGNILEENNKIPRRVLESGVAQLINDILADNEARTPIFGPRSPLYFEGFKVSAKTGTTDNFRDGWAIGYTPDVVVGVWVGNNDQSPMQKEPGIVGAGPIFHQLMEKALTKL